VYKEEDFAGWVLPLRKKVVPIVKYVAGSFSLATTQVVDAGADVIYAATQGV
jgi:basic membrane protein A